jgi:predicted dehydrogenase
MNVPLNVLIIGAGNIGAFFDKPESRDVLTHAHAFKNHPGFKLLGFIDSNYTKALNAAKIWNVSAYKNLQDANENTTIDIVVVCTPDGTHYDVILEAITFPIKLLFVEKPLSKKIDEAIEIKSKVRNISIVVNYSRRFSKDFDGLQKRIQNGEFGSYLTGNGYYGKGVLHNGTHMIDLLRMLVGEISDAVSMEKVYDFYKDDPTVTGLLVFENNRKFYFHGVDCKNYTVFELEMLFEKAKIRLLDSCFVLEEYSVKPNKKYEGYNNLELNRRLETDMGENLSNAVENIYRHLTIQEPLKCTLNDAFNDMCIALKIS